MALLKILIVELCNRDMLLKDVGLLLGCSLSSARNYINELSDADIVRRTVAGPGQGNSRRYRIIAQKSVIDEFLEEVGASPLRLLSACRGHDGKVWRDPLVTALFGARAVP